jgi:DNA-binding NtrC family response regulator
MMMIMILHLIQTSLEKADLSVSSFTDPLMALETFRQTPSSYDLVISDIRMRDLHLLQVHPELNYK